MGTNNLAGLIFVLLNLPLSDHAAPVPNRLIIDPSIDKERALAIQSFMKTYFASARVVREPIIFKGNSRRQRVRIPGMIDYDIELSQGRLFPPDDADDLYPWLSDPRQGMVRKVTYRAPGSQVEEYSRTNSIFAKFRIIRPSEGSH